jgi:hypothetical protein
MAAGTLSMWTWLRYFGILLGGLSIFSLVHEYWLFALTVFSAEVLDLFRAVFHAPIQFILSIINIFVVLHIPPDFVVLWVLFGAILWGMMWVDTRGSSNKLPFWFLILLHYIFFQYAIVWPYTVVHMLFTKGLGVIKDWAKEILNMLLVFAVLFALNAAFA